MRKSRLSSKRQSAFRTGAKIYYNFWTSQQVFGTALATVELPKPPPGLNRVRVALPANKGKMFRALVFALMVQNLISKGKCLSSNSLEPRTEAATSRKSELLE